MERAAQITLRQLLRLGALRQRPERIIVGEVRGEEAMEMLHAMGTGHDGSLTTIHACGPRAALNQLETLAALEGANVSPRVVRQMIGTAIDLVIHLSSFGRPSGQVRRLANVAFVDENVEDSEGRPALFEFCRYHVLEDEWEVGEEGRLFPPPQGRGEAADGRSAPVRPPAPPG